MSFLCPSVRSAPSILGRSRHPGSGRSSFSQDHILLHAIRHEYTRLLGLVLGHGQDPDQGFESGTTEWSGRGNASSTKTEYPLALAVRCDSIASVHTLLRYGASPNVRPTETSSHDSQFGTSEGSSATCPLELAWRNKAMETLLLKYGAEKRSQGEKEAEDYHRDGDGEDDYDCNDLFD